MEENNQNTNTPPVQSSIPEQNIPTAPPVQKKFKLPILPAVIVAFLLIIGTASAAYLLLNKKSEPVACTMEAKICPDGSAVGRSGPKCEFAPCPSSQAPQGKPIDTSNWKTYTSTESAYSFKYPNYWDTQKVDEKDLMIAPKEIVEQVRKTEGGFGGGVFLTMMIHEDYKSPSDWFKSDETKQVTSTDFMVANSPATKYILKFIADVPGIPLGSIITDVVVETNGKNYAIELLDNSHKQIFEQILSTFKFTSP